MRAPAACSALAVLRLLPLAGAGVGWAEGARPTVVDVPSRPAFVQPPGSGERPVRVGESLLERGRQIAWIRPGTPRRQPLRFRTLSGTATIPGTTVVLEVSPEQERIFSWEGNVGLRTAAGREWVLAAGQHLQSVRGRCVVLFADLVGFTGLSHGMEADALFSLVNGWFAAVARPALEDGGLVDKCIGDALMVEFGLPRSRGDRQEALATARAPLRMQSALEALNRERKKEGLATLRMGIALHVGEVMAGTWGCRCGWSPRRSAGP